MRERVTVVTLSVCHSVCHFPILEKAPFSGLKPTSVYILGDDLSALKGARTPPTQTPTQKLVMVAMEY